MTFSGNQAFNSEADSGGLTPRSATVGSRRDWKLNKKANKMRKEGGRREGRKEGREKGGKGERREGRKEGREEGGQERERIREEMKVGGRKGGCVDR